VQVTYPKRTDKPLYHGLVKQLDSLNIPFLPPEQVTEGGPLRERYEVIVDAIFGFSFHGSPRPPFDTIVQVNGLLIDVMSAALLSVPCLILALCFGWQGCMASGAFTAPHLWCLPLVVAGAGNLQMPWAVSHREVLGAAALT
jgi:hypothetical protein